MSCKVTSCEFDCYHKETCNPIHYPCWHHLELMEQVYIMRNCQNCLAEKQGCNSTSIFDNTTKVDVYRMRNECLRDNLKYWKINTPEVKNND